MVDVVACQFWFAGFAISQDKMDEISDEIEEMTEKVKKELENLQYSLVDYQKRMRDLKP
ncbi:hypothetical protein Pmar_PMAR009998 [Perkinsus marinus ATCC 50983]|uniref:Uncharacterized protein n=1 Tax=Perkinsus marinus (strain ATCC 50983 / TXsc) TaxID=423536 RepID=C5L2U2_PERM5|nr:hypothetical protein Pmar_PMAR009998 [Perkinsus marinus ATCC 50983]EER09007.1 hypothetical protein Pmar_PMAR009998 [Perkinsus marinus ATCC 50983]|eukprot:XP_002777191.1 hypothetical protein Pmar_PMAR009998 [Perkinsus marinus ATCC 50983]